MHTYTDKYLMVVCAVPTLIYAAVAIPVSMSMSRYSIWKTQPGDHFLLSLSLKILYGVEVLAQKKPFKALLLMFATDNATPI